ncbi:hypothetical protein JL722_12404 [Aureococcus anophagefferens]|nr:hypothetical protein JL722_12404 [Aureococcus anophagefferens]
MPYNGQARSRLERHRHRPRKGPRPRPRPRQQGRGAGGSSPRRPALVASVAASLQGDGTALPDDRSALTDDRSIGDYSRAYAAVADCLANAARASGPAELSADEAHALAACGSLPPCPEGFELSFVDGGSMAHALKTAKHGPRREPSTHWASPTALRDGGDRAHANHGVYSSDLVTPDGTRIPVERDNHFPTFAVSIFSEGQLEEQGYRFHTTESARGLSKFMITPAGDEVKLMTWRNLKMVYVRAVAPQPAPEGLSAAAVSEPPWPEPQPRVEAMEIFAGSGSMSRALWDGGVSIVATCENDPRKAGALANNLPSVHNYGDIHDDSIVGHVWNPRSVSAIAAGVECQDYSKAGARRGLGGPKRRTLERFAHVVRCIGPHLLLVENVWPFVVMLGLAYLVSLLSAPKRSGESRYILRLPTGVEEAELSKSSLHGPVYRDRMLAYFERDDVSPLLPPPAPLIAPKIAERRTLVSCLRAADEVPDDAFWEGRFERLSTPRRAYSGREDSPLVVARLHYDPESAVREGVRGPRAMGIDITGIAEHDVQYVVGDGVTDVYKMQAAARIMERATMLHKVLHERSHAASVAAPLLAAPASPPLRHPTAGPNAPPLMARGLGREANVVHAAIGHPAQDRFRDTVKGLRIKVDGTVDCAVCKISRMVKSGSARKSRTQNPPAVRRPPPPPHPPPAPPGGQPAKQRPPTLRLDLFGAHSDIPSRTRSQYFLAATLNTNPPHRVGVGLRLKSEAVGEPGGFSGLRMIYNAYAAKGIRVRIVEHDDGGEFVGNKASALYAQLGVASRPRPSERHCEAAERTNRAVYGLTRAMMHAGSVPDNLWEDAACHAVDCLNLHFHGDINAHYAAFQDDVDLSTFYPFYAHVAFFDMHRSERFRTSGALGRYLGAARNYGFGAIRVQVGRHVRIVSSHHVAAPDVELDVARMAPMIPPPLPPTHAAPHFSYLPLDTLPNSQPDTDGGDHGARSRRSRGSGSCALRSREHGPALAGARRRQSASGSRPTTSPRGEAANAARTSTWAATSARRTGTGATPPPQAPWPAASAASRSSR